MRRYLVVYSSLLALAFACDSEPLLPPEGSSGRTAATGGSGNAGGEAGESASGGEGGGGAPGGAAGQGGDDSFVAPQWLSETGLFENFISEELAPGVRPFTPAFELWSDGVSKRRWIWLPEGTQIDTSDMTYWRYPVGTKVWKEFTIVSRMRRLETRLLQKIDDERWFMMAFQWNGEGTDAAALPDGQENARNTDHDIPSTQDCARCHESMPDVLLGVTALQLSHDGDGVTLDSLIEEQALSDVPEQPLVIPGSDVERNALGYLHANCGMCHHPESVVSTEVSMELWLRADELGSVEATGPYRTALGTAPSLDDFPEATSLIEPGEPEHSAVFLRMNSRDGETQMPPLGTEQVDVDGIAAVQSWIDALPK
jgi:hypothetical protein